MNTPDFEGRNVTFITNSENATCLFDPLLLRRAITNIVINAMTHNDRKTEVRISLDANSNIKLVVADNGNGVSFEVNKGICWYHGNVRCGKIHAAECNLHN